jgi:hypothetical protein
MTLRVRRFGKDAAIASTDKVEGGEIHLRRVAPDMWIASVRRPEVRFYTAEDERLILQGWTFDRMSLVYEPLPGLREMRIFQSIPKDLRMIDLYRMAQSAERFFYLASPFASPAVEFRLIDPLPDALLLYVYRETVWAIFRRGQMKRIRAEVSRWDDYVVLIPTVSDVIGDVRVYPGGWAEIGSMRIAMPILLPFLKRSRYRMSFSRFEESGWIAKATRSKPRLAVGEESKIDAALRASATTIPPNIMADPMLRSVRSFFATFAREAFAAGELPRHRAGQMLLNYIRLSGGYEWKT